MESFDDMLARSLAGRYEIQRELGSGGMATVYLALDVRHDRPVAVKVVRPELAGSLTAERFLREIRLAAKLNHRSIVPLFDSGEANGILYYVMPFVDGESLRDRLTRESQLPVDVALQLATDVAEGLAHASAMGVIHRDIKPENIMISDGHAAIVDFGIAKAVANSVDVRLTGTGVSIGTPMYMSPEQLMGEDSIDHLSDQYALACVLHEMLTGQPPYMATNAQAIRDKHLTELAPSARASRPGISLSVDAAIQRGLAKVPGDRFPGWSEFIAELRPAPPERLLTRRTLKSIFLSIALVAAGALAWLIFASKVGGSRGEIAILAIPFLTAVQGWRAQRRTSMTSAVRAPLEIPASFESGLFGGLIGGAVGGLFIGALNFIEAIRWGLNRAATPWFLAETFLFGALAGAVFGATILLGVSWARRFVRGSTPTRIVAADLSGAAIGGVIGGACVGVLLGLIFARRPLPPPDSMVLFTGTSFIGAAIVAGTLLYDYRGRMRRLAIPLVGGTVVTAFAVVLTAAFFPYEAVIGAFWLAEDQATLTAARVSIGGLIIGGMAGLMLGLQTGGTMAIRRAWDGVRSLSSA